MILGTKRVLRYLVKHTEKCVKVLLCLLCPKALYAVAINPSQVFFCTLLITGAWMAFGYGWIEMPWLQQKLWLVLLLIVPLEVADIWLGNWKVQQLVNKRIGGDPLTTSQQALIHFYRQGFTSLAILTLPIIVLLIMWLAVSKQALF